MNLPNKLTIFRILLIPVIIITYSITPLQNNWIIWHNLSQANFIVLLLMFVGALTDLLDGKIARKYNLVTNLGKFLDPLADKLITATGFIILLQQNYYNQILTSATSPKLLEWWMVIVIFAREFIVTGIRLLAVEKGRVIAASWFGKIKTTLQFITIIYLLAGGAVIKSSGTIYALQTWFVIIAKILIIGMLAATIFSGADYFIKNIDLFKENKKQKKNN